MKDEGLVIERPPLNGEGLDIIVGIPSYNEADSIRFVVDRVSEGLRRFFPHRKTAVVNADNYSRDGTREVFLDTPSGAVPKVYLSTPEGIRGKGNNFHNLFQYIRRHRPRVTVVLDADLKSVTPDWPAWMAEPILKGYDFVTPVYSRNEYDGTITNHLCYPLLFALLGRNIRQPIGGDFAFSETLMRHWMRKQWSPSIRHYGVDIFMTSEAVLGGFRLAQVALGAKIHKPSAPKLDTMFCQVMETLFTQLLDCRSQWDGNGNRVQTPDLFSRRTPSAPQALSIDYKLLKKQAHEAFRSGRSRAREILPAPVYCQMETMFEKSRLRLTASTWAQIVYSFLKAFDRCGGKREREKTIEALKGFYFARVVSFIKETLELDHQESEKRIVNQAKIFRRHRRDLLESRA